MNTFTLQNSFQLNVEPGSRCFVSGVVHNASLEQLCEIEVAGNENGPKAVFMGVGIMKQMQDQESKETSLVFGPLPRGAFVTVRFFHRNVGPEWPIGQEWQPSCVSKPVTSQGGNYDARYKRVTGHALATSAGIARLREDNGDHDCEFTVCVTKGLC